MKELSFWRDHFPFETQTTSALPPRCDIAIIGAGLTGLSTALHAARSGASVVVLEQERIGWGASTRNAGMALTGLKLSPEQLVKRYGRERARKFYRASLDALAFVQNLIEHENLACDFHRCGDLCVAYRRSHYQGLIASQKFMREEFEHHTELVSAAEMARELGTKVYHGGLIDPLSAGLHPAKLVAGLARCAHEAGVQMLEATPVEECHRAQKGFELKTSHGMLHAKEVVVATNGYTPAALRHLRRRIIPVGSYIIVTVPLGRALAEELLPTNRMVYDTKNFLFYFRRTPDERLLFGGRTSFTPMRDREAANILRADMLSVFPQLHDIEIEYAWHGNVGFTFDQMPHLGEQNGLHYAMGYGGHGVVMSVYFGYWLAQKLLGADTHAFPFFELQMPARFFYRKRPWFLPLAGAYYRVLDRWF
ncbi:FAD-binding oxidoreductase [candidate division KSB1 bacterium]|nr:FAD-binding oxidoreductase [candidate division KSB1 bacterium]